MLRHFRHQLLRWKYYENNQIFARKITCGKRYFMQFPFAEEYVVVFMIHAKNLRFTMVNSQVISI